MSVYSIYVYMYTYYIYHFSNATTMAVATAADLKNNWGCGYVKG